LFSRAFWFFDHVTVWMIKFFFNYFTPTDSCPTINLSVLWFIFIIKWRNGGCNNFKSCFQELFDFFDPVTVWLVKFFFNYFTPIDLCQTVNLRVLWVIFIMKWRNCGCNNFYEGKNCEIWRKTQIGVLIIKISQKCLIFFGNVSKIFCAFFALKFKSLERIF
jgi:hypothetical protein